MLIAERNGQVIEFDPKFRFIGTMNPPEKGYEGRVKLSKAFRSRVSEIYVPNLDSKEEFEEIMVAKGNKNDIPAPLMEKLVELHSWIIDYIKVNQLKNLEKEFSMRQLNDVFHHIKTFTGENESLIKSMLDGIENNFASRFSEQKHRDEVMNEARRLLK